MDDENERMRAIKNDSKVSTLKSWNNGVGINRDKVWLCLEQDIFGKVGLGFQFYHIKFEVTVTHSSEDKK